MKVPILTYSFWITCLFMYATNVQNYKYSIPLMEKYKPQWPEYKPINKRAREVSTYVYLVEIQCYVVIDLYENLMILK